MSEPKLKTISINPEIFSSFGGSKTQKKRPDKPLKVKAPAQKSEKNRKKEILQRIRENQERQYKKQFNEPEKSTENPESVFNNSFEESVKFMETVVDNSEKVNLNKTLKNREHIAYGSASHMAAVSAPPFGSASHLIPPMAMTGEINKPQSLLFHEDPNLSKIGEPFNILDTIEEPQGYYENNSNLVHNNPTPIKIQPAPQYGCLKGGMMPTYRNYTIKNRNPIQHQNTSPSPITNNQKPQIGGIALSALTAAPQNIVGRIRSPEEVIEMKKLREANLEAKKNKQKHVPKKVKKIMKRTFRVGRDKYKPAVGVLLPNKTIKNDVTAKSHMLKQTPIAEVRKFLLKTGFIKVGSSAPNDVLRKIYESIKLIDGDVKNHNPDNLLFNFFSENNSK